MKVVFAGTPEFAGVALQALHAAGFELPLVLTQPDRPAGRGLKLQPSPVKTLALAHGIPVLQPQGLRLDGKFPLDAAQAEEVLASVAADVMVVAAYGLILPAWVLALPRLGCINIHASLLPRWRGAAPIHRAIEAGDAETGITIMQMDAGLDTGPMLMAEAMPIDADDTTATLQRRLAELGGRLVVDALHRLERGALTAQLGVTYARKVDKAEASIDWTLEASTIERRLRAFDPFPGATALLDGELVKLWRGSVCNATGDPGEVLSADAEGIVVACGSGALALTQLQRPGGRRLGTAEFLQRRPLAAGMRFETAPR
jgi:methionyl-tRNA formyltransferase